MKCVELQGENKRSFTPRYYHIIGRETHWNAHLFPGECKKLDKLLDTYHTQCWSSFHRKVSANKGLTQKLRDKLPYLIAVRILKKMNTILFFLRNFLHLSLCYLLFVNEHIFKIAIFILLINYNSKYQIKMAALKIYVILFAE